MALSLPLTPILVLAVALAQDLALAPALAVVVVLALALALALVRVCGQTFKIKSEIQGSLKRPFQGLQGPGDTF